MEEFEKYKGTTGTIDWGKYYSDKSQLELDEPNTKSLPLEELHIYKLADELSDLIWEVVSNWDYFAKKTLGDQIVRSADSVGANIAEGYGRYFFGENLVFLYYSRGSLIETKWWCIKAKSRKLMNEDGADRLLMIIDQLSLELNKVIKITKVQSKKWVRK